MQALFSKRRSVQHASFTAEAESGGGSQFEGNA